MPDEIVEWYRRLCKVAGEPALHDVPQANRLWHESSRAELLARARELGADYLVLDRPHTEVDLATTVYANAQYMVVATER